ncbi:hypothetical protein NXS98_13165 [Fontisphaera persica]|uniref:hypothetical protein n=1 Tax=Fontisphaera persica TaxID=2974023 RepID=UPI0024BFC260|nr:hypothetical protein [Fontisphaera persica]WCJ58661.1 hypothetical protein NXS98_13165 [Fontisphaera persica]
MHSDWLDRALSIMARALLFIVKSLCLFVPTFLVVYVLGTILLTACFGILTGTPHLILSRDLSGIPFIWYAFGMAWRLAIIASALVWMLATLFAAIGKQHKSFLAWLAFMLIVGVLVGGLSALPVLSAGASELNGLDGSRIVVAYLLCFAAVGAFACGVLSALWYFAYHKWFSLNPDSGCPAQTV